MYPVILHPVIIHHVINHPVTMHSFELQARSWKFINSRRWTLPSKRYPYSSLSLSLSLPQTSYLLSDSSLSLSPSLLPLYSLLPLTSFLLTSPSPSCILQIVRLLLVACREVGGSKPQGNDTPLLSFFLPA